MLMGYRNGVKRCTSGEHFSDANVLVISHIWFSIFLLGFGYSDPGCPFTVLLYSGLGSVMLVVVSILLSSFNSA